MPFTDPASGRQYEVDPATGQSRWLDAVETPAPPRSGPPLTFTVGGQPPPSRRKRSWPKWVFGGVGVLLLVATCSAILNPTKDSTTTTSSSKPAAASVVSSAKPAASSAAPATQKSSAPAAAPQDEGTTSQQNALRSAKSYIEFKGFSKLGLIQQLSSSFGDGFSKADATWAVAHVGANWNEQAVRAGQSYLDMKGFSRAGLIQQLSSPYGDKFTKAEATYAADKLGLK